MSTPEPAVADDSAKNKRKQRLLILGIVVLVLGVAYAAYQFFYGRFYESTDDAYVAADVMQITSEVAGTVSSVLVDDTQQVERGQPLVELDRADAQVALAAAQAELARTVREVRSLYSQADGLRAQLRERRVQLDAARADVKRRQEAGDGGAVSAEELQHARDRVPACARSGGAAGSVADVHGAVARERARPDRRHDARNSPAGAGCSCPDA
jgi:membrane fusion protein, multidrug efflux system